MNINPNWPPWMKFAAETDARLERLKTGKSYHKERERLIYHDWQTACERYGYRGSSGEYEQLVVRVSRGQQSYGPRGFRERTRDLGYRGPR